MNEVAITFGGARLDRRRRIVLDVAGRETVLRAKSFDVLEVLLERADEAVSKDELFNKIWNGVSVSEDTLVQCITEIRKAIGITGHKALKTVTKVGYRLVPDGLGSVAVMTAIPSPPIHQRGIAVLPFGNLSDDPEQDYLADGLAEDVITDLSNSSDLFVIARNSSFSFRNKNLDSLAIARDLGVRYLVEGSVRKSGSRLRITVQLVDTQKSVAQIWAERYDRPYSDVFDIQDDIARQVAQAIVGKLSLTGPRIRQRPANMEVYELSLRSRNMWMRSKSDCNEVQVLLSRAVELDPNYAITQSQMSLAHMYQWAFWMHPDERHRLDALTLSKRAVGLDPEDAVIRGTHGWILLYNNRWEEGIHELDAALAMNPNGAHVYAIKSHLLAMTGEPQKGLDLMQIAAKLNPHPPNWHRWLHAVCYQNMGQYKDCIAILQRPELKQGPSRRTLIVALELDGQHDEARKEAGYYMASDAGFRASIWMARLPYRDEALKQQHFEALVRAGIPE